MSTEAAKVLENVVAAPNAGTVSAGTAGGGTAPTANAPAPKVEDPQVSSKLETLARREQAALNAERAAASKVKEIEAREAKVKEFELLKDGKPLDALKMLGYDYDQITKAKLLDGEVPPEVQIQKLQERLDKYESSQTQKEKEEAERATQSAKAAEAKAVSDFKSQIGQYLSDNADRYELINFEGEQDLVYEVIDEHYNRTIDPATGVGKVMTKAEAADKVELYLEQKYEKSRDLKKVSALLNLRREAPKVAAKPEIQRQPPRTLNNQLSASQAKPRTSPVTDEERVQRAIAYAKALRPSA